MEICRSCFTSPDAVSSLALPVVVLLVVSCWCLALLKLASTVCFNWPVLLFVLRLGYVLHNSLCRKSVWQVKCIRIRRGACEPGPGPTRIHKAMGRHDISHMCYNRCSNHEHGCIGGRKRFNHHNIQNQHHRCCQYERPIGLITRTLIRLIENSQPRLALVTSNPS